MNKTIEDFIGNTPLVRLQRLDSGFEKNRQRHPRQAGGQQPGGFGEGPAGDLDDPARRGARRDQEGRRADRAHLGQHRHRPGDGRGDPRLPHGPHHAGAPVDRAAPDHARLRRRDHPHAAEGRHGGRARPRRADGEGEEGRHARPVRQPGQSARALRDHRARRSGATPKARSPTSSPRWAPPAPSWAARATSRRRTRRSRSSAASPRRARRSPASASGRRPTCRRSTTRRASTGWST